MEALIIFSVKIKCFWIFNQNIDKINCSYYLFFFRLVDFGGVLFYV